MRGRIRCFPAATDVWSDGRELGDRALAHRPARLGAARWRWSARSSPMPASPMSTAARSARARTATWSTGRWRRAPCIEPLALAYAFDATEQDGHAAFRPARRRAGRRIDRRRSGAAGRQRAGASDRARRKPSCRARSRIGFTDVGADYQRARRDLAPAGRRLGAQRACRPGRGHQRRRRRSAAPKSGCRICGPGAKARSLLCRRAGSRLTPGDVVGADGQRPAAADRVAADHRYRERADQGALDRSGGVQSCRWRRRDGARRQSRPPARAGACAGARPAGA